MGNGGQESRWSINDTAIAFRAAAGSIRTPRPIRIESLEPSIEGIVFSKDRAFQLHALLCSYKRLVKHPAPLTIVYMASQTPHEVAYSEVKSHFEGPQFRFVTQSSGQGFRPILDALLNSVQSKRIFFLVDDIVFTEQLDLRLLAHQATPSCIPSLRLGRNLSWSYTTSSPQPVPKLRPVEVAGDDGQHEVLLAWRWACGDLDWAYPLSLDGNIFQTDELRRLLGKVEYSSPNTLEAELQRFRRWFSFRWGVCFAKSRIVNLPINRVQADIPNLHGNVHQDYLLELWNGGLMMDTTSLQGWVNVSAHQEASVQVAPRHPTLN